MSPHREPDHPPSPPSIAAPPAIRWLVLAGLWLLYLSFGLTTVGLAPLVAPVTRDLDISHTAMGGVLGIWQLTYIASAVPCGALLDRLGARRAMFIGGMIIALSGALRGVAWDYLTLCLAVAVFGLGGPIVSAGAPKVVSQWFHGRDRGLAMGIYITGPAIGSMIGLSLTNAVLMPAFAEDWRSVLLLWASVAAVASIAWFAIASQPAARRMEQGPSSGSPQPQRRVIGQLLRLPAVRLVLLMSVGIFMFNHGLNSWLPELLRSGGMSATAAGYWATLPTAVGIFGSLLIPRLATPDRRFAILALLCAGAVLACLLLLAGSGPLLAFGLVLQGIARSSLMTVMMLILVETPGVGEKHAGTAGGLFFSAAEIGGASGPVVLGLLHDATGAFSAGLYLLAGICALLLLGVARLSRLVRATSRPSKT